MRLAEKAAELLDELESHWLTVELVPSRRRGGEGMIRVAVERNADWYRRFVARHPSPSRKRRWDTVIRRRETAKALRRLAAGCAPKWPYDYRLCDYLGIRP